MPLLHWHNNCWLESHNIYNTGDFSTGACENVPLVPITYLFSLWAYVWESKADVARQMIILIAILTGGALGGCKPLIKAIVNDAESAEEIKPLLFPFP